MVMRHGDRRPKEKLKFKTKLGVFLKYFEGKTDHEAQMSIEGRKWGRRGRVCGASLWPYYAICPVPVHY